MTILRAPNSVKFYVTLVFGTTLLYPSVQAQQNQQTISNAKYKIYVDSITRSMIFESRAERWEKFQLLASEWKVKRGAMSSITEMSMLEPYQRIIGMGHDALPFILSQLKTEGDDPDQWFWALKMITASDPVRPEHKGDYLAMAQDWIAWGESEGYVG